MKEENNYIDTYSDPFFTMSRKDLNKIRAKIKRKKKAKEKKINEVQK